MTSKFSHRRTRVQHKPKVCISKPPRPANAPPPGYTILYDFHVEYRPLLIEYSLDRAGSLIGEQDSDWYTATGLDDLGNPWFLRIYWPPSPGIASTAVEVPAYGYAWIGMTTGWFSLPWGPIGVTLFGGVFYTGICNQTITA
jgi:hypothetical protein